MSETGNVPPGVDPTRPSAGRLYDYYLGGTDNFEVDRVAGERIRAAAPELYDVAWVNRGFLQRAARWLADDAGIRQFIDIGAGLPTRNNTHDAVGVPNARVVYVDNDPMVIPHAKQLLENVRGTTFVEGDMRRPEELLEHPDLRATIDVDQPVALMLAALVHFVADEDDPWGLINRVLDTFPSGSYLALSHLTSENNPQGPMETAQGIYRNASEQLYFRTKAEIGSFFGGLEMIPPYAGAKCGICHAGLWGADDCEEADSDGSRWWFVGVGRKP